MGLFFGMFTSFPPKCGTLTPATGTSRGDGSLTLPPWQGGVIHLPLPECTLEGVDGTQFCRNNEDNCSTASIHEFFTLMNK